VPSQPAAVQVAAVPQGPRPAPSTPAARAAAVAAAQANLAAQAANAAAAQAGSNAPAAPRPNASRQQAEAENARLFVQDLLEMQQRHRRLNEEARRLPDGQVAPAQPTQP
jgi:hypothetical protein